MWVRESRLLVSMGGGYDITFLNVGSGLGTATGTSEGLYAALWTDRVLCFM